MDFLSTVANILFSWVLDANAADYSDLMNLDVPTWVLIMLLIISFATPAVFYFITAKNTAQATKKNYIVTFFLGLLVLWLVNLFIVPTIVDNWEYAFGINNLVMTLIDTVYYAVLYEIVSLFYKDLSNAKHIHLLNSFS